MMADPMGKIALMKQPSYIQALQCQKDQREEEQSDWSSP